MPSPGSPSRKGARDRTTPQRIVQTTLEAEALRLRRQGHAFDEIAEMLGITSKNGEWQVRVLIENALERKGKPDANALRQDMLDGLDRLKNRAIRIANQNGPDRVAAINAATNVYARMSALVGSDAPKQVDIKDDRAAPIDATAAEKLVARLAEEARRDAAQGSGGAPAGDAGQQAPVGT